MKTALRLLACGGAVLVPFLAVAGLTCNQIRWSGPGGRHGLDLLKEVQEQQRRSDDLDDVMAAVVRRRALKQAVVEELLAGRITLRAAAARFRAINEAAAAFPWDEFRRAYPGSTDEERHCREVIAQMKVLRWDRPGEMAEVVARLEAELQDCLERDGTIRLPEVER